MIFINIPSGERQAQEREILNSFSIQNANQEQREYAECVAARTREVLDALERKNR
jgi:hypothetical protein